MSVDQRFEDFYRLNERFLGRMLHSGVWPSKRTHAGGASIAYVHQYGHGGSDLSKRDKFCLVACFERSKQAYDFCGGTGKDVRESDPVRHLAKLIFNESIQEYGIIPVVPLECIVAKCLVTGKGKNSLLFICMVAGMRRDPITRELQARQSIGNLDPAYKEMTHCTHVVLHDNGTFDPPNVTEYVRSMHAELYDILWNKWQQGEMPFFDSCFDYVEIRGNGSIHFISAAEKHGRK